MQRGITKSNRLEANSSPIAEPSVKAVSLKRNKMNKPQVKIETFKKINGSIQIDYNGAYVGSLRPSPPWFKEDGIDTESIANLITSASDTYKVAKEVVDYVETNGIDKWSDEEKEDSFIWDLYKYYAKKAVNKAEGK